MEGSKEQALLPPKEPLSKRLIKLLKHLMELNPGSKKYFLEEICNSEAVAKAILGFKQFGGESRWKIGFSIVTVLSNIGYSPIITSQNYFKNLSPEGRERYLALRQTLRQLSARETDSKEVKATRPLLEYPLKESDAYGETFHYRVVNPTLLRELSQVK